MKIKSLTDCKNVNGGIVFGYHVNDPHRYGVVEFDENYKVVSLEEKPTNPKSNYASLDYIIMITQLLKLLRT